MRQQKFANGLRVITVPVKSTKTITVLLLVGTGSKYETKDINGLSHFLEHMFFKGTRKRPSALKLIEPLDKVGGRCNAFTSQEYTGYWAKVDGRHLDLALDWMADVYLHSKLAEEEIDRERGTILQELNMYLDTPMHYISDLWTTLLYGDQPAGWHIIGTADVISSVKRADFLKYLKEHYLAANTIVTVAGQVDDRVVGKVKQAFSGIRKGQAKDKLPVAEKQTKPESLIYYKKTDQTHLHIGFRGYDIFNPNKHALGLLAIILGGNMSSRLWIAVRERLGLAYYVGTAISTETDAGFLATKAGVDNRKVGRAIKTILREYKRVIQKKISAAELKKAKDYTKGTALIGMESSDEQASFIAFQELLTGQVLSLEEKFAEIDAVTVDDIHQAVQECFRPEKLNLALIGPFKNEDRFNNILATF